MVCYGALACADWYNLYMDIVSDFTLNSLIQIIDQELKEKHLMSALFMALTIPDICSKNNHYIEWYDTWVANDGPFAISGEDCYRKLRCGILHNGKTKKGFSLSCDSKNDIHLGHIICIETDNNTGEEKKHIRVNINELVENILEGTRAFIDKEGDIELFRLMDYGKVED